MSSLVTRRSLLYGMLAAPAIVAFDSLMPIKGVLSDPLIRVQSWPFGTDPEGDWWTHRGPLSRIAQFEAEMRLRYGKVYWTYVEEELLAPDFSQKSFVEGDAGQSPAPIIAANSEGSQFGHRPAYTPSLPDPISYPIQQKKYRRHSTKELKAELARVCKWGV